MFVTASMRGSVRVFAKLGRWIKSKLRSLLTPDAVESTLQVYRGYQPSDKIVAKRYLHKRASVEDHFYTDGFGVKTLFDCVPFVDAKTLQLDRLNWPFPDDGFHAEGMEYAVLLDAVDRFAGKGAFCAVEAGAGWGPWLAMAGVVCRHRGVDKLRLLGAEASKDRFALMQRHLDFNELNAGSGVDVTLFRGAVWSHDGVVFFPDSAIEDMGVAATSARECTDYRGQKIAANEVPCCRLDTLVGEGRQVDFLHLDIQGAEGELISSHLDWLGESVASMMIATHSRPLEGELMLQLNAAGWILHREKPCRFNVGVPTAEWTGETTLDGGQYWINAKFAQ